MIEPSFQHLAENAGLLLAVVLLFDILAAQHRTGQVLRQRQVFLGVLLGGVGIAVMLAPWQFAPGIVFDTRSVLLGISGLFFGWIPTVIAMVITAVFRLYQGGAAALTGVCVILATGAIGLAWRRYHRGNLGQIAWYELYLFGVVIHVAMLVLMFTLPWETALRVLSIISLPVMLVYPIATLLLGTLLANRLRREQAVADLLESEERVRLAVTAGNVGFFDRDLRTNRVHFSPEWKKQLGYAPDEIGDEPAEWQDRIHPDDLDGALVRANACIRDLKPVYESQYRLRHKDGSYRWILARGLLEIDDHGQALRLLGCHVDVTQQKVTEAALRASEENYRQLFEQASDGIFIADEQGNYVDVNLSGCDMLGYTRAEILKLNMRDLASPEGQYRVPQRLTELKSGRPAVGERRMRCKDGSLIQVEINGRMLADGRMLGVVRDIRERKRTEDERQTAQAELRRLLDEADLSRRTLLSVAEDQKHAEEQYRQLNAELEGRVFDRTAQLEAANKELEAFSYSVSHDLRAPLRAMDGFSAILISDYFDQLDEAGRHYLERIQEASRRMGQLINDLLDLSRVTRTEFVRQPVDLSGLAGEISAGLQAQSPARAVKFEIEPGLLVQGDRPLLHIVLENLLSNAVKFSSRSEAACIQVGAIEQDGKKVYFVRDNGVGFDMTYVGKLFAPFQRLHGIDEFPGTGIGLVTIQRIIRRHGGRIWPEAQVGFGATFYFTLGEAI